MLSPDALNPHRPALRAHCYRMLGHPQDAEDAVQDTLLRAVRYGGGFEGRASPRTYLLQIATRVCLDALAARKRRRMPTEGPPGDLSGPFAPTDPAEWVAPFPGAWLAPLAPDEQASLREQVGLALVTLLQTLPPRQRAALLLAELFDWSAAEVAEALGSSVASVNSALQRAREQLARGGRPQRPVEPAVLARYREAFERYDIDALAAMLAEDITFDMPPIPLWLRGRGLVARFLAGPGAECRGSVLVPVAVNDGLGFAQYRHGGRTPWALVVLEAEGDVLTAIHSFLDVGALFPLFGLPPVAPGAIGADEPGAPPRSMG